MILTEFLPERAAGDIVAGRLRLRFGDREYLVPVLTIDANEAWQETFKGQLIGLFAGFASIDDAAGIFARFAGATTLQLDLLAAYDTSGALPPADELRRTATADQLLRASMEVLAASYPPVAIALDLVARNPETIRTLIAQGTMAMATSSPRTNGAQPSTAGPRPRSGRS